MVNQAKIVYIVTRAEPIGGAQIHVRDIATAIKAEGHFPTVITKGGGPFVDAVRARNIPTILVRHLSVPINPVRDMRALREIRGLLAEIRPDLLAVHSSKAGILGRLAGRSLRIPVILTAHGWNFTPGVPPVQAALYRQIERCVGPFATRIITVSEFDRQLALDARIASADRVVTVHNGMPDIPLSLRADPSRTPVRLIMVARFGAQKDHATLLRALADLTEYVWELDLVGDGPLMAPMQALAADLGIGGRIRFLGQRIDVAELLAAAQVCLLVSNWEGFPRSILEAMRASLPVIASSVGGVGESVLDGETGYIIPPRGVEVLRKRIGQLLADPSLRVRLGAAGRRQYERHFTLDQTVAKTLAVYRDALEGVKSPNST